MPPSHKNLLEFKLGNARKVSFPVLTHFLDIRTNYVQREKWTKADGFALALCDAVKVN